MSNEPIMSQRVNCDDVRDQLALLLYGELSFDQEERVELHLDTCADCRTALAQQKAMHAAIDGVEVTPSPALLARCREDFSQMLYRQDAAPVHSVPANAPARGEATGESWWSQVLSSFDGKWNARWNTTRNSTRISTTRISTW